MRPLLIASVVACLAAPLSADEKPDKGRIGVDGAFNGGTLVGLTWHASEKVAIRPAVSFSHNSGDSSTAIFPPLLPGQTLQQAPGSTTENHLSSFGFETSVLVNVSHSRKLTPYIVGTYFHSHSSGGTTNTSTRAVLAGAPLLLPGPDFSQTTSSTSNTDGGRALLGARHAFTDRFSLFGEVGVTFSWSRGSQTGLETQQVLTSVPFVGELPVVVTNPSSGSTHNSTVGTLTGQIGAIFYLK